MSETYQLQDATIDIETAEGTAVALAGLTEASITPSVTIEQLYTGDTIKIEDQMQSEFSVQVDITVARWDEELAKEWLGGDGSSATSMTDTAQPAKFEVTGTLDSHGGTDELSIVVEGVTFEEMPLADLSQGEFQEISLSGTGEDLTEFDEVSA